MCGPTSQMQDHPWEQALHWKKSYVKQSRKWIKGGLRLVYSSRNAVVEQTHSPLQTRPKFRQAPGSRHNVSARWRPLLQLNVSPKSGSGSWQTLTLRT